VRLLLPLREGSTGPLATSGRHPEPPASGQHDHHHLDALSLKFWSSSECRSDTSYPSTQVEGYQPDSRKPALLVLLTPSLTYQTAVVPQGAHEEEGLSLVGRAPQVVGDRGWREVVLRAGNRAARQAVMQEVP
jgi:hypothetical protein